MDENIQVPQASPETLEFLKKKQIFLAAFEQAYACGMLKFEGCEGVKFTEFLTMIRNAVPTDEGISLVDHMIRYAGYMPIIYSHDFAKAFFGEGNKRQNTNNETEYEVYANYWVSMPAWKFHLMQMVVLEKPLLYLEPFIRQVEPKQEWR